MKDNPLRVPSLLPPLVWKWTLVHVLLLLSPSFHTCPPPLLTLHMGQSCAPLPKWGKVGMGRWQCEEQVSCLSLWGGVGGRVLVEECWTGSSWIQPLPSPLLCSLQLQPLPILLIPLLEWREFGLCRDLSWLTPLATFPKVTLFHPVNLPSCSRGPSNQLCAACLPRQLLHLRWGSTLLAEMHVGDGPPGGHSAQTWRPSSSWPGVGSWLHGGPSHPCPPPVPPPCTFIELLRLHYERQLIRGETAFNRGKIKTSQWGWVNLILIIYSVVGGKKCAVKL